MSSRAVISIVALMLVSVTSFAQDEMRRLSNLAGGGNTTGSLAVTVRDSNGGPVPDARVEIRESQRGMTVASGYTNSSGFLELANLPLDTYDVAIVKGLTEVRERVDVRSVGATMSAQMGEAGDPRIGGKSTVSVAQFKVPGKARKEYQKATDAVKERKLEEAEKRVAKALEIYPKYADALTLRAIFKMDRNELESAAKDLDDALQYDPANATAYFVYGANFNLRSKFDEAIQSLERGVTLNPAGWQGYFELGKAYVGKQNYKQALKYLDKAQSFAQMEYPAIHLVKAHALLAMKDYSPAMDELQAFLDKSPQDPRSPEARKMLDEVKAFAAKQ